MRAWWLLGCVALAGTACGGVVRSSPGSAGQGAEGGTSSAGGKTSASGTSTGGQTVENVPCGKSFCPAATVCCNGVCGQCSDSNGVCPNVDCQGEPLTCQPFSVLPAVLACVRDNRSAAQPDDSTFDLFFSDMEITGEIAGALEGGCLEPLLRRRPNGPELAAQAMSWTLSSGELSWQVEAVVEGEQIPSLRGQRVNLTYVYEQNGFGYEHRELSLVSRMSPSHGVWIVDGGTLEEFQHLPLFLDNGASVCATNDSCGDYARYDITATDPRTMQTLPVSHGQSGRLGPWLIKHGGYAEPSGPSGCPDWSVADVHAAILGLM